MINRHIYVHTSVPSPYRAHMFRLIATAFSEATFYFHERDVDGRPWKYDWADWGVDARDGVSDRFPLDSKKWSISKSIYRILRQSESDSVHLVWMGAPFWDLMLFALYGCLSGRTVILWNDGAFKEAISSRARWRYKILSRYCFAGAFTPGKIGFEYFEALNFKPEQIVNSFFSHDVDLYKHYYETCYVASRGKIRESLGVADNELVLLNISRFIDWKRLVDLAVALQLLEKKAAKIARKIHLVLIGDGKFYDHKPLLDQLTIVRVHNVAQMPPFEIMSYYCASDLFVFPSEGDIWGLVVNEALSMGVPVICTNRIGASELVHNGENGFVVPARRPDIMAQAIVQILSSTAQLQKCKENARAIVDAWNSSLGVKNLCAFVASGL